MHIPSLAPRKQPMNCGNYGRSRSGSSPSCSCIPPGFWDNTEVMSALSDYDAAEVIRLLRRSAHGLDQTSVAAMTGLSQSTVSRIESGRTMGLERSL
ncbi:helix-turn-helix domain-containing protein, partial [Nocardiopsis sp. LOL_012]|uniref:helix-turn-helix domain-containing protein n=1 Tax=Nocardiopsis sp. LOL_012 TaxID=3345409 RepID=UPI003A87F2A4